jgi:lipoprotein signal peptidase
MVAADFTSSGPNFLLFVGHTSGEEVDLSDRTLVKTRPTHVLVLASGAVIAADQLTKSLAAQRGLVQMNPAYALGVVGGTRPVLVVGALLVLGTFLVLIVRPALALGVPPLFPALVTGGLVSNALDRIRFGAARDYLTTPWVIVNLADIAVAVGIVAFVVAAAWRVYSLHVRPVAGVAPLT